MFPLIFLSNWTWLKVILFSGIKIFPKVRKCWEPWLGLYLPSVVLICSRRRIFPWKNSCAGGVCQLYCGASMHAAIHGKSYGSICRNGVCRSEGSAGSLLKRISEKFVPQLGTCHAKICTPLKMQIGTWSDSLSFKPQLSFRILFFWNHIYSVVSWSAITVLVIRTSTCTHTHIINISCFKQHFACLS